MLHVFRQMVGRAGRAGMDKTGQSILLCQEYELRRARALMTAALPPLQSALITSFDGSRERFQAGLVRGFSKLMLEFIGSKFVKQREDVPTAMRMSLISTLVRWIPVCVHLCVSIISSCLLSIRRKSMRWCPQCWNSWRKMRLSFVEIP